MGITDLLLFIVLILILVYLYLDRKFTYWSKKGVHYLPPSSIIFGNVLDIFKGNENCATFYNKLYRLFPGVPFCGYFEFQNPVLLLRDPQIIQTVLVEKFNCFHDNKFRVSEKCDLILGKNPAILPGKRWKDTRGTFIAAMTPSKIKMIEEIVKVVSNDMIKFIDEHPNQGIEAHDLATRFMSETVANYSWGIRSYGFSTESTVKEKFDLARLQDPRPISLVLFHPFLAYWLDLRLFPKELEQFMLNVTEQVYKKIGKDGHKASIVQYIANAKEKSGQDVTLHELVGHVGTVFLDGYDTSSRVLSNTIFMLMLHPDIQQKARDGVLAIQGDFTIDSVNKVEYLDMIILEILRLYPPVPLLGRKCTEACTLGSLVVDVGTEFIIPVYALAQDPEYFPDPLKFNPEHFSEQNKSKRHKFAFLPFGQGPRMCAGMRFALAEIKLILCNILKNYEIIPPVDQEVKPITPNLGSPFFLMPEHTPYIQLKKLNV